MTQYGSILQERAAHQGFSLRFAHRPRSIGGLARILSRQACRACGSTNPKLARGWELGPDSEQLGGVFYCTLTHTCPCGLSMPIFVVLNDLLRAEGHACDPADEALQAVEAQLPPLGLELGLVQTRSALHRGDYAEAVMVAEALVERFPERVECCFNAGCARQNMGDTTEALEHYRRTLELHPQLGDAWRNRALLLRKVGRLAEARFCIERLRQSGADGVPQQGATSTVCRRDGAFGLVRVLQNEDLRALFIGDQCQGAMYLSAEGDGPRPGPFAYSPFTTGWLLAGCRAPRGRGLMLGLGSGAGAITMLANFPELRLRVVEFDDVLIDVARTYFPRLRRLERQGRLEIIHADARDVVGSHDPHDFVLLDLFTGNPEPPLLDDSSFMTRLAQTAPLVLANAIFTVPGPSHAAWLARFAEAGLPIRAMYPTGAPERWARHAHNWILSSSRIDPPSEFTPFCFSRHFIADAARADFRSMCARVVELAGPSNECRAPAVAPMGREGVVGAS